MSADDAGVCSECGRNNEAEDVYCNAQSAPFHDAIAAITEHVAARCQCNKVDECVRTIAAIASAAAPAPDLSAVAEELRRLARYDLRTSRHHIEGMELNDRGDWISAEDLYELLDRHFGARRDG
jgi:hypothetical protein